MKRNYISVEHRRKIIEEKRKKDEQKDDSKVFAYRPLSWLKIAFSSVLHNDTELCSTGIGTSVARGQGISGN